MPHMMRLHPPPEVAQQRQQQAAQPRAWTAGAASGPIQFPMQRSGTQQRQLATDMLADSA